LLIYADQQHNKTYFVTTNQSHHEQSVTTVTDESTISQSG